MINLIRDEIKKIQKRGRQNTIKKLLTKVFLNFDILVV